MMYPGMRPPPPPPHMGMSPMMPVPPYPPTQMPPMMSIQPPAALAALQNPTLSAPMVPGVASPVSEKLTTLFVGSITDGVSDEWMDRLLNVSVYEHGHIAG